MLAKHRLGRLTNQVPLKPVHERRFVHGARVVKRGSKVVHVVLGVRVRRHKHALKQHPLANHLLHKQGAQALRHVAALVFKRKHRHPGAGHYVDDGAQAVFGDNVLGDLDEVGPGAVQAVDHGAGFENIDGGHSGRQGVRLAAVRGGHEKHFFLARVQDGALVHDGPSAGQRAKRKPVGDAFAPGGHVGVQAVLGDAAGKRCFEAGDHFVQNEEGAMLVAQVDGLLEVGARVAATAAAAGAPAPLGLGDDARDLAGVLVK